MVVASDAARQRQAINRGRAVALTLQACPKRNPKTPSHSQTKMTIVATATEPAESRMSSPEWFFSSRSRMKLSGIASSPDTVEIDVNRTAWTGPRSARTATLRSG